MIRAQPNGWLVRTIFSVLVPGLVLVFECDIRADVINFTGNVGNDFPSSDGTSVIAGQPGSVAESPYILQHGWTTGFLVESIRISYDKASDTLFVGVQTYSITGDADGNGNPGFTTPEMAAAGGV